MPLHVRGLYPIVDFDCCARHGVRPLELARMVLAQRPRLFQVRAKDAPAGLVLELLDWLVPEAQASGVGLVVNDRADLALMAGAPAVHVGHEDLRPSEVRSLDPALQVGMSSHSLEELERALAERPDYVAFGPVFATGSKAFAAPVVGLELLQRAHDMARAQHVPLVAIGGVGADELPEVARRCDAVAVISALFAGGNGPAAVGAELARLSASWPSPP